MDDETVFYVEIFSPDRSYDYEAWADALEPWMDRFVD